MSRKSSNTSTYLAKEGKATLSGIDSEIKKLSKERDKNYKDYKTKATIYNDTVNVLNFKRGDKPGDQLPYFQREMYTNRLIQLKPEIKTLEGNHANYKKRIKQLQSLRKRWTLSGGKKKTRKNVSKKNKKVILPKLRKIDKSMKNVHYRINDPFSKRKLAIHDGVKMEAKKKNGSLKKAAIAKKGRFNILRIYRRFKKVNECKIITKDMKYMDKKYGLNDTKDICGKK